MDNVTIIRNKSLPFVTSVRVDVLDNSSGVFNTHPYPDGRMSFNWTPRIFPRTDSPPPQYVIPELKALEMNFPTEGLLVFEMEEEYNMSGATNINTWIWTVEEYDDVSLIFKFKEFKLGKFDWS